jgi:hypothetical protein
MVIVLNKVILCFNRFSDHEWLVVRRRSLTPRGYFLVVLHTSFPLAIKLIKIAVRLAVYSVLTVKKRFYPFVPPGRRREHARTTNPEAKNRKAGWVADGL